MQKLFVSILCICSTLVGFAQTKKITGTVYNSAKEPLVAASVVEMKVQNDSDELKNANYTPTTNGTFTLGDGTFELEVTENQSALEISYIGYKTLIVPITTLSTYSIVLQPDAISIQTVVVTVPYSKQKKETYTGSLSTVSSATLSNSTESSFDKALQGQVPGVVLSTASGQPGASSQIQLRGTGSISAGSEPLIVIDGVVMYSGETTQSGSGSSILSSINPNDIESISVLKDASATSLYGSRGSNGVIMITTKQGKKDKSTYTYSTTQGVGMLAMNNFELLTADQYKQLQTEGMKQAGMAQEDIAAALQQQTGNTNWFDEVYAPAWYQTYEFTSSGGNDKTTYFLSSQYKDEEGIVQGTDLKRFSTRINIQNVANPVCTYGVKFNPSFTNQHVTDAPGVLASPVTASFLASPTQPVFNGSDYNFDNSFYNPAGLLALNKNYNKSSRMLGSAFITLNLSKKLVWNSLVSIDYLDTKEEIYRHPQTPDGALYNGSAEQFFTDVTTRSTTHTLTWNKSIANTHNVQLLGGVEAESMTKNLSSIKASNFPVEDVETIFAASKMEGMDSKQFESSMLSAFSNMQYNYKSSYFLSASIRADGSSKFHPNHRWGTFWSVGGSWIVSNEEWMKELTPISFAKLRASYGTSGNANIQDYAYMQLYEFAKNYNDEPGSIPTQIGTEDLTWEKNNTANIGVDVQVHKRIDISLDAYHRKTYDLLLLVPIPSISGYTHQFQNVGAMTNKGVELMVQAQVYKRDNMQYTTAITLAHNTNTITELYSPNTNDTIVQGTKIRTEGHSFQSFYLAEWAGVNSADGSPMWYDANGELTKDYNKARKVLAGTADPKLTVGWNNTVQYKLWSCGMVWYYNYGNLIFNQLQTELQSDGALWGKNQSKQALDYWKAPGDAATNPKLVQNNSSNSNEFSTRYLESGSYLRLKQIQVSYTIQPKEASKAAHYRIQQIQLNVQANNVWVLSSFTGLDPETRANGVYYFDYPKQRLFSGGVSVRF